MRSRLLLPLLLAPAACLGPAPPPPPPPFELAGTAGCAATVFPTDPSIGPATVDRFLGNYAHGRESVSVLRQDHRLLVHRVGAGVREVRAETPGGTSFRDGCGVRYVFTLPVEGRGARLTIVQLDGSAIDWWRRAY